MKGCLGAIGCVLMIFGTLLGVAFFDRDAMLPFAASLAAAVAGYWMAKKTGVFDGIR